MSVYSSLYEFVSKIMSSAGFSESVTATNVIVGLIIAVVLILVVVVGWYLLKKVWKWWSSMRNAKAENAVLKKKVRELESAFRAQRYLDSMIV